MFKCWIYYNAIIIKDNNLHCYLSIPFSHPLIFVIQLICIWILIACTAVLTNSDSSERKSVRVTELGVAHRPEALRGRRKKKHERPLERLLTPICMMTVPMLLLMSRYLVWVNLMILTHTLRYWYSLCLLLIKFLLSIACLLVLLYPPMIDTLTIWRFFVVRILVLKSFRR